MDVVTELLARIGETAALSALSGVGVLPSDVIPIVRVRSHEIDEVDIDVSYEIEGEPRRLVYVPGFDWMWYNAKGPEE